MRALFRLTLLSAIGAGFIHCSADGTDATVDDADAGTQVPADAGVDSGSDAEPTEDVHDGGADVAIDASTCSADGWCATKLPASDLDLTAVWSFSANDAVAASRTKLLQWDGTAWSAIVTDPDTDVSMLTSLWATGPNDIWGVAQYRYRLVHGTRQAAGQPFTWTQAVYTPATSPALNIVRGNKPGELWIYGTKSNQHVFQHGVVTSEDDGNGGTTQAIASWTTIAVVFPTLRSVNSFWVTPNDEIWVSGLVNSGVAGVLRGVPSVDDPTSYTWTQVLGKSGTDFTTLSAIWAGGADDVWTTSSSGSNFRGAIDANAESGVAWTSVPSNSLTEMNALWGVSKTDAWAVGRVGAVRHWDGTSWTVSQLAVDGIPMWQDLAAIHVGPAGDAWAVGAGVALHRVQGGTP